LLRHLDFSPFCLRFGAQTNDKSRKPSIWKTAAFSVLEPHSVYSFDALRDGTSFPDGCGG